MREDTEQNPEAESGIQRGAKGLLLLSRHGVGDGVGEGGPGDHSSYDENQDQGGGQSLADSCEGVKGRLEEESEEGEGEQPRG